MKRNSGLLLFAGAVSFSSKALSGVLTPHPWLQNTTVSNPTMVELEMCKWFNIQQPMFM